MDVASVAAILLKIAQAAPTVIQTAEDLMPIAAKLIDAIKGGDVSDQDIADLNALVDDAFAESQEPI